MISFWASRTFPNIEMGKIKRTILLSFRTKVIVPVVVVMVLLMGVSMLLVNQRVTVQFRDEATKQLVAFDAVFKQMQQERENQLLLRFRNIVKESRFKALATLDPERDGLSEDEQLTIRGVLFTLTDEDAADGIIFSSVTGQHVTVTRDPHFDARAIEASCSNAVELAMQGSPAILTAYNSSRLFDTVSIPIQTGNRIAGTVTFAVANSLAQEFNQQTQCELVLLSDGNVVATTLRQANFKTDIEPLITPANHLRKHSAEQPVRDLMLNGEHFLAHCGEWSASDDTSPFQYVILSSYERPLQVLASTQNLILLVSTIAIVLGVAVIWFVVSRVTRPLELLRAEVEAVGTGDLNRRIEVKTMDECGELAEVFNQMTENLKASREQIESTVESLKTTQAQLVQSEKLSGIGEFVAGVAHELNNPLTSVMGFSELLQLGEVNPQQKRHLDVINKSAKRCQKIVQNLLSFARKHVPERKIVSINSLVESAADILGYQLRTSNIEVTTQLDPHLPSATADPHQLQQVFINIINNGRQAMEGLSTPGKIQLTTSSENGRIKVIFQDNGPGIREENISKLFDPFFTTKEVGKGTGLGLSICYGIIQEHGGKIVVQSQYGHGAKFIIELPITTDTDRHTHSPVAETTFVKRRAGNGQTVLVIDDEETILEMTRELLETSGYEVRVQADVKTALAQLQEREYSLIICDWKMPGMNGQQFFENLRQTKPALAERVIFMTGDIVNETMRTYLAEHDKDCLAKPFSLKEFEQAIQKSLASAAQAG